jgi:O-methyltransferase
MERTDSLISASQLAGGRDGQLTTYGTAEGLYLDLLKACLTRRVFGESYKAVHLPRGSLRRLLVSLLQSVLNRLASRRIEFVYRATSEERDQGRYWPMESETMIGLHRLDNLQYCITDVVHCGVPGDLIETGVWRGGASIFMRAILKVYGDTHRRVWVADSFQGLPRPDAERYPADAGDDLWTFEPLAVSLDRVKANFERYGLLDEQVRFLPGWFRDTLPAAPIERLSVLRLDGDLYESTIVALRSLYPKLSAGGYVIVDDYGAIPGCRQAVHDFRSEQGISEEMVAIDWSGVYWQRLK